MHYRNADNVTFLINNRAAAAAWQYRGGDLDSVAGSFELPDWAHLTAGKLPLRAARVTHQLDCLAFYRRGVCKLKDGSINLGRFHLQQSEIFSFIDCDNVVYGAGVAVERLDANKAGVSDDMQVSHDTIGRYEKPTALKKWTPFPVQGRNNNHSSFEQGYFLGRVFCDRCLRGSQRCESEKEETDYRA